MKNKTINLKKQVEESEELSGPESLYVKTEVTKVETYGFFLRFIHQQFEPCPECQLSLLKLLKTNPLRLTTETIHISFHQCLVSEETGELYYEFGLPFVVATNQQWKPCSECQKELADLLNNAQQLHIGNIEFSEPVELWMKYMTDEESWKEIEKRPSTSEEQLRLKNKHWA